MIGNISVSGYQILNAFSRKADTSANAAGTVSEMRKDGYSPSRVLYELSLFSALTRVKGRPVVDLKAVNNVLTVENDVFYKVPLSGDLNAVFSTGVMMWEDLKAEVGIKTIEQGTVLAHGKFRQYLSSLLDGSQQIFRVNLCDNNDEIQAFYKSVGLRTGEWATIHSPGLDERIRVFEDGAIDKNYYYAAKSRHLYIAEDGMLFSEEEIEDTRLRLAQRDWRQDGYSENNILVVNGKEYTMDENGHYNVPKGEPVIWGHYLYGDASKPTLYFRNIDPRLKKDGSVMA